MFSHSRNEGMLCKVSDFANLCVVSPTQIARHESKTYGIKLQNQEPSKSEDELKEILLDKLKQGYNYSFAEHL